MVTLILVRVFDLLFPSIATLVPVPLYQPVTNWIPVLWKQSFSFPFLLDQPSISKYCIMCAAHVTHSLKVFKADHPAWIICSQGDNRIRYKAVVINHVRENKTEVKMRKKNEEKRNYNLVQDANCFRNEWKKMIGKNTHTYVNLKIQIAKQEDVGTQQ